MPWEMQVGELGQLVAQRHHELVAGTYPPKLKDISAVVQHPIEAMIADP